MGRPRAGLRYKVGKHGSVYVPVSGGKKSGCLSGILSIFAILFVIGLYAKIKAAALWVKILLGAIIIGATVAYVILARRGDKEDTSTKAKPVSIKPVDCVRFTLRVDDNADAAAKLRQLIFGSQLGGVHAKSSLTDNEDGRGWRVMIDGVDLGTFTPELNSWLNDNVDSIAGVTIFNAFGGGTRNGEPVPYYLSGTINLKAPQRVPEMPEVSIVYADTVWGVPGGSPCYVSRTGTAHNGHCGTGLYSCEPMTVQEAAAAGCKPCSKCFY